MNAALSKEPRKTFVPANDRPEVKLAPDAPLSYLKVRDLAKILGQQLPRRDGLRIVEDQIDKCCRDVHDLISSPPRDVPGLKELIEAEAALPEHQSNLSNRDLGR
jgi:hypothetical protein